MEIPRPPLVAAALAGLIIATSFGWFIVALDARVVLNVELPVLDVDSVGAGTELRLTLENAGRTSVTPSFWVMWSAFVRQWDVTEGPESVGPGETVNYVIRVPEAQIAIPDGIQFVVKAFDAGSSVYFRSPALTLELVGGAPIRNPALLHWSRDIVTGQLQPLSWHVSSAMGPDDRVSVAARNATGGATIQVAEGGQGVGPTFVHVQQTLGPSELMTLREAAIVLCWDSVAEYRFEQSLGDPVVAAGIELFAGDRLSWLVFSRTIATVFDAADRRIFVNRADIESPGCSSVPIRSMIDFVGVRTTGVTFVLFVAAWPSAPGEYSFTTPGLSFATS